MEEILRDQCELFRVWVRAQKLVSDGKIVRHNKSVLQA